MKTFLRYFCLFAVVGCGPVHLVWADANQPAGFRLILELRDGSRVIGTSKEKAIRFQSEVLGDVTLPLEKIRYVEVQSKTNGVKITTANGDSLQMAFATAEIPVMTTYGVVKLPVGMVNNLRVLALSKIGRPQDGLVALWSGEDNALDTVSGGSGVLQNVGFTDGVVGKAFSFLPDNFPYGPRIGVMIADKPAYALTKSLTIEGWVRPRGNGYVIFFRGDRRSGMDPYSMGMDGQMNLTFTVCGADGNSATVHAPVGLGAWIHVAGVLDDSTGTMSLYTNGVLAVQTITTVRPFAQLLPEQSPGIGIGNVNDGGNNFPFIGDIDELALYNRALSADEVNASYAENMATANGRADPLPPRGGFPRMYPSYPYPANGIRGGVWNGPRSGFISD